MLTVRKLKPNVFELRLKGVVEKPDIETMARELTPALKGAGPIGLILRLEDWRDVTADAMAEDMKFELGLLPYWSRIARMAVVTDLQAFAALLKWIDPILPMIDMRSFPSTEVAAAEAFVMDLPERATGDEGAGIKLLADGSDGVVAFEVDGRITEEGAEAVFAPLRGMMDDDTKVNVLAKFTRWDGFDPAMLMDGSIMGTKFALIGHLKRYAIVGAPEWMQGFVSMMAPMMPFEMQFFDAKDEAAAREWVGWT